MLALASQDAQTTQAHLVLGGGDGGEEGLLDGRAHAGAAEQRHDRMERPGHEAGKHAPELDARGADRGVGGDDVVAHGGHDEVAEEIIEGEDDGDR